METRQIHHNVASHKKELRALMKAQTAIFTTDLDVVKRHRKVHVRDSHVRTKPGTSACAPCLGNNSARASRIATWSRHNGQYSWQNWSYLVKAKQTVP